MPVEFRPMDQVTVRKLDHAGREIISYPGLVLERDDEVIVLRTAWNRRPLDLGFVVLEPGDRWTETFFSNRWYNVFQIRARDGHLKGWYCNVTRPACITPNEVAAEDLALDLWVGPEGGMMVLDEDEFAQLPLCAEERGNARRALDELKRRARKRTFPFDRGTALG